MSSASWPSSSTGDERRRLLAAATGVEPAGDLRLTERVRALEAAHPEHDLDPDRALARLSARPAGAAPLRAAVAAGNRLDWEQLVALAGPVDLGDPAVLWDLLSVAGRAAGDGTARGAGPAAHPDRTGLAAGG